MGVFVIYQKSGQLSIGEFKMTRQLSDKDKVLRDSPAMELVIAIELEIYRRNASIIGVVIASIAAIWLFISTSHVVWPFSLLPSPCSRCSGVGARRVQISVEHINFFR